MSLQGKVALVTGGGTSRPTDSARRLAEEGVELALHFNSPRGRERTLRFYDELRRTHSGIKVSVHGGDLSTAAAVEQLFDNVVAQHRKIDIVVNTAGVVLSDEQLFTYLVFVDQQSNKWTDRYSEALHAPPRERSTLARAFWSDDVALTDLLTRASIQRQRGALMIWNVDAKYSCGKQAPKPWLRTLRTTPADFHANRAPKGSVLTSAIDRLIVGREKQE